MTTTTDSRVSLSVSPQHTDAVWSHACLLRVDRLDVEGLTDELGDACGEGLPDLLSVLDGVIGRLTSYRDFATELQRELVEDGRITDSLSQVREAAERIADSATRSGENDPVGLRNAAIEATAAAELIEQLDEIERRDAADARVVAAMEDD